MSQNNRYLDFCEQLWRKWIFESDFLERDIRNIVSNRFRKKIEYNFCPEPYLSFMDTGINNSLYFLTTNPGAGIVEQKRENIEAAFGVNLSDPYEIISSRLANYYEISLRNTPAGTRISKMKRLTELLGYSGFKQIELFPFHSSDLSPSLKKEIINLYHEGNNVISQYILEIKKFLVDKNVVVVAASNKHSINELNEWLKWICFDILELENVSSYTLGYSATGRPSKSVIIDKRKDCFKIVSMLSGINNLPNDESLTEISQYLK